MIVDLELPGCSGDGVRGEIARMELDRLRRERGQNDSDGASRWVGPCDRPRGSRVTKRVLRTALAAGRGADIPAQPAWSQARSIVVPGHQPGSLRFHAGSGWIQEL